MVSIDPSKIKTNLVTPKKEDFNTFDEYLKKKCEYLVEKYKETYVKE
jgi:hypothetical protein